MGSLSPSADLSGRRVKVPPLHVGTECKNAVCSDGRACGQGRWFTFKRHRDCDCVVSPCVSRPAFPELVTEHQTKELLLSRKEGPAPAQGRESHSSPASWGSSRPLPQLLQRPPPSPATLCHLGLGLALCWLPGTISLKRQLFLCSVPTLSTETLRPSLQAWGKGAGLLPQPQERAISLLIQGFSILATHLHHLESF